MFGGASSPKRIFAIIGLAALFVAGCGATRNLRPLGDGNSALHFSLGGPIVTIGVPIPVPYSELGYSYGLGNRWNLHGSFQPTAALYKTAAFETGAAAELLEGAHGWPEIMFDMRMLFVAGSGGMVAFPIITPVFSYSLKRWTPYLGIDSLFQVHDNDRPLLPKVYSPFGGARVRAWDNWNFGLELKWQAINHDLNFETVKHPRSAGTSYGVLAPYIYVGYEFK